MSIPTPEQLCAHCDHCDYDLDVVGHKGAYNIYSKGLKCKKCKVRNTINPVTGDKDKALPLCDEVRGSEQCDFSQEQIIAGYVSEFEKIVKYRKSHIPCLIGIGFVVFAVLFFFYPEAGFWGWLLGAMIALVVGFMTYPYVRTATVHIVRFGLKHKPSAKQFIDHLCFITGVVGRINMFIEYLCLKKLDPSINTTSTSSTSELDFCPELGAFVGDGGSHD